MKYLGACKEGKTPQNAVQFSRTEENKDKKRHLQAAELAWGGGERLRGGNRGRERRKEPLYRNVEAPRWHLRRRKRRCRRASVAIRAGSGRREEEGGRKMAAGRRASGAGKWRPWRTRGQRVAAQSGSGTGGAGRGEPGAANQKEPRRQEAGLAGLV